MEKSMQGKTIFQFVHPKAFSTLKILLLTLTWNFNDFSIKAQKGELEYFP